MNGVSWRLWRRDPRLREADGGRIRAVVLAYCARRRRVGRDGVNRYGGVKVDLSWIPTRNGYVR